MNLRLLVALAALGCASRLLAADPGWVELLKQGSDSPWKKMTPGWVFASDVALDPANPKKLKPTGDGPIWVNGEKGNLPNLVTKAKFGDCEAHVEFLIGKGSNAGFKFNEVYEIQIRDTAGVPADKLTGDSTGGIYPTAELLPKYRHLDEGIPPKVNAAKPAGEWQTLDVTFRAARFDADGKKTANAKIVKAVLNGQVVHEDQEMKTPTGHNYTKKEEPTGAFLLQNDHGPVAWRNVKVRSLDEKK
jgi:hypothetical protein